MSHSNNQICMCVKHEQNYRSITIKVFLNNKIHLLCEIKTYLIFLHINELIKVVLLVRFLKADVRPR